MDQNREHWILTKVPLPQKIEENLFKRAGKTWYLQVKEGN